MKLEANIARWSDGVCVAVEEHLRQFYDGWGQQRTEKEARSLHSSQVIEMTTPGDRWVTEV